MGGNEPLVSCSEQIQNVKLQQKSGWRRVEYIEYTGYAYYSFVSLQPLKFSLGGIFLK